MAQAPTVTIAGVIYTHFNYQLGTDTSLAVDGRRNNFDVNRSYITLNGRSGRASARITADVDGRRASGNQQTFRLKYAWIGFSPTGSPLGFKLGAIPTPFIEFDEAIWGYRMQGTVALDRNGFLTSSDFGFSVEGSWLSEALQIQAGVFNGEGYSAAPGDHHKDVAGRVTYRLARSDDSSRIGGLRLTGFALVGQRDAGGPRNRYVAMLSYRTSRIAAAAQFASTKDSLSSTLSDVSGRVISAYATYGPSGSAIRVIGRVDVVDPDTDTEPEAPTLTAGRQTRVIAGVSYQVAPNVRFLMDADFNSLRQGSPTPAFEASRRGLFFHAEYRF